MSRRIAIALFAALLTGFGVLLYLGRKGAPVESLSADSSRLGVPLRPSSLPAGTAPPSSTAVAPPEAKLPKEVVTLFFEGDDQLLHRELREVAILPGETGRLRSAVGALLAGPATPAFRTNFPGGGSVRALFFAPPGVVTVDLDFTPESLTGFGVHQEWLALESLVATVLAAAPSGTEGVLVTIRGETPETFAGHVDLSRPLWLDRRLLAEDEEPSRPEAPAPAPRPESPTTPAKQPSPESARASFEPWGSIHRARSVNAKTASSS